VIPCYHPLLKRGGRGDYKGWNALDTIFQYGKWVIILSLIYAITVSAWSGETVAQNESSEAPTQSSVSVEFDTTVISLSLKESILFAIRNNFDVEIARMNPEISDLGITIEKAKFDPVLKVEGEVKEDERPVVRAFVTETGVSIVDVRGTRTDLDPFTSTVERLFETGGKMSLAYGFNYIRNVF
jgi:hypothetical protein